VHSSIKSKPKDVVQNVNELKFNVNHHVRIIQKTNKFDKLGFVQKFSEEIHEITEIFGNMY
jgi:hypothetical protein